MEELPIHPMIVHFPLVFAILLPIVALIVLLAIRGSFRFRRLWAIPVLLAGALVASAFVAVRSGEAEEEKVEAVVSESVLHQHEEAGERFLWFSAALFVIAGAGLAQGRIGRVSRVLATVASFGVGLAAFQVGAAGGELVYREGAASAYTTGAPDTDMHVH